MCYRLTSVFAKEYVPYLCEYSLTVTPNELLKLSEATRKSGLLDRNFQKLISEVAIMKHQFLDTGSAMKALSVEQECLQNAWNLPDQEVLYSRTNLEHNNARVSHPFPMRAHKARLYNRIGVAPQWKNSESGQKPGGSVRVEYGKLSPFLAGIGDTMPSFPSGGNSFSANISLDPDTMHAQARNAPASETLVPGSTSREDIDGSGSAPLHRHRNPYLQPLRSSLFDSTFLSNESPRIAMAFSSGSLPCCSWLLLEKDPHATEANYHTSGKSTFDEDSMEHNVNRVLDSLRKQFLASYGAIVREKSDNDVESEDQENNLELNTLNSLRYSIQSQIMKSRQMWDPIYLSSACSLVSRILGRLDVSNLKMIDHDSLLDNCLIPASKVRNAFAGTSTFSLKFPRATPWEQFSWNESSYAFSALSRLNYDADAPYWIDAIELKHAVLAKNSSSFTSIRLALKDCLAIRFGDSKKASGKSINAHKAIHSEKFLFHPLEMNSTSTQTETPQHQSGSIPAWASASHVHALPQETSKKPAKPATDGIKLEKLQKWLYKTPQLPVYCAPHEDIVLELSLAKLFQDSLDVFGHAFISHLDGKRLQELVEIGSSVGVVSETFLEVFRTWAEATINDIESMDFDSMILRVRVASVYTPVFFEESLATSLQGLLMDEYRNKYSSEIEDMGISNRVGAENHLADFADVSASLLESIAGVIHHRGFYENNSPLNMDGVVSMIFYLAQAYRGRHSMGRLQNLQVPELCKLAQRWLFDEEVVKRSLRENTSMERVASLLEEIQAVCEGGQSPEQMKREFTKRLLQKPTKFASDTRLRTPDSNFYRRLSLISNVRPCRDEESSTANSSDENHNYKGSYGF